MSSCFSLSVSTVASVWCFWIFSGLRNIVPEPNIKRGKTQLSQAHTHISESLWKHFVGGGREKWGPGIPVPQLDFGNFDHQSTSSLCKINSRGFLYFQVCYTQLIGVLVCFVWRCSVYYFSIFKSMIFRYFHLMIHALAWSINWWGTAPVSILPRLGSNSWLELNFLHGLPFLLSK